MAQPVRDASVCLSGQILHWQHWFVGIRQTSRDILLRLGGSGWIVRRRTLRRRFDAKGSRKCSLRTGSVCFQDQPCSRRSVVQAFVFRAVVAVGDVVQLWVGCHHFFKYAAFDNHKAGWRVMNFHKTVYGAIRQAAGDDFDLLFEKV